MRATMAAARSAAGYGIETGRVAIEDTRNAIVDVLVPIYLAGIILPIPVGMIGDLLGLLFTSFGWELTNRIGEFFYHLGHIPAALAFIAVGYYYWQIVVRGISIEILIHALPNWLQKRVAKWSLEDGRLGHNFRLAATIGLWAPVALWVAIEFPVWRHWYHYIAILAGGMALTYIVFTSKKFETFWRNFYGWNLLWIFARHLLGLIGIEVVVVWNYIASATISVDMSDESMLVRSGFMVILAVILTGIVAVMVKEIFRSKPVTSSRPH